MLRGGCLLSLLQNPKALQTQLSASCVRPSARRSPQSSWVGSCAPTKYQFRGPGPRGTERRADGAAVRFRAPPTPRQSCSRTGRAGGSPWQLQRQPRPPSPPRPTGPQLAPGSGEEPRRGRRPGHCAAGASSRGLSGQPRCQVTGASAPASTPLDSRSVRERPLRVAPCPASGASRRPRSAASDAPRGPPRGGEKPCLGLQQ